MSGLPQRPETKNRYEEVKTALESLLSEIKDSQINPVFNYICYEVSEVAILYLFIPNIDTLERNRISSVNYNDCIEHIRDTFARYGIRIFLSSDITKRGYYCYEMIIPDQKLLSASVPLGVQLARGVINAGRGFRRLVSKGKSNRGRRGVNRR